MPNKNTQSKESEREKKKIGIKGPKAKCNSETMKCRLKIFRFRHYMLFLFFWIEFCSVIRRGDESHDDDDDICMQKVVIVIVVVVVHSDEWEM